MPPQASVVIPGFEWIRHRAWYEGTVAHWQRRGFEVVLVEAGAASGSPAAARNSGVRQCRRDSVVVLEPGDRLFLRFLEQAPVRLGQAGGAAVVTSWARLASPGSPARLSTPTTCDLATLLVSPEAIHRSSMFPRSLWERLGGFDESLTSLEDYDFWLRALESGAPAVILEELLFEERPEGDAPRGGLEEYLDALRAVFQKHRPAFERAPSDLLSGKERVLQSLAAHHRCLARRRQRVATENEDLTREAERLRQALAEVAAGAAVDWGDLRRTAPVDPNWGYERGTPVDRYYIEGFLASHADDIRGAVLEVQENEYTKRFGGGRVTRSDVIDADAANPRANIVADLREAHAVPSDSYDCFILTQTLHVIDDMRAVLAECARILRPGGVLLATLPCLSRVCLEYGPDGDFWRVTEAGARRLFAESFEAEDVAVRSFGNVLVNTAFQYGLGCHELSAEEFEAHDPYNPMLVGVRAVKARRAGAKPHLAARALARPPGRQGRAAVLLYHRVARPGTDHHGLAVDPSDFREHMEELRRYCHPMALDELSRLASEGAAPPGAVALTFDDGYVDSLSAASPVLLEFELPATFFLTTAHLRAGGEFWWDTLERIFLTGTPLPAELEIEIAGRSLRLSTRGAADRLAAHACLNEALVRSRLSDRERLMDQVVAWTGQRLAPRPHYRPLSADEVVRLAARPGHAIGAHTAHHLALPFVPLEESRQDVAESRTELENLVGQPLRSFAYPYGAYDDAAVELVRAAGFEAAVTCVGQPLPTRADALRLPRLEITRGDGETFARQLRAVLLVVD